ncbi:MAG: LuxR family transcriptional regulator [Methylotenera sp.]|nr:LuxR family transcriptional regulator [Methylotenera sp.]
MMFSIATNLGFDQTLFAVLKSKDEPIESAFLRSNYSKEWRSTYDSSRLGYVDPTVTHCLKSAIPLLWTPDCFARPDQKNMYEEATGYGLRSGIIFPIHGPNGEFGMMSFVSEQLANPASQKDMMQSMGILSIIRDYVFESSKKFLTTKEPESKIVLTPRENEVVKWTVAGKSSWEISKILNCSESTINFHLSNIRQKFNVNTKQQAIIKALKLGIIQL